MASGAAVIVMYTCAEAGGLSYSCAAPGASDDVHLLSDRYGIIQRQRPVSPGGPMIDALLVTSLSPHVAKITLNSETGDSGLIEERDCGCLLPTNVTGLPIERHHHELLFRQRDQRCRVIGCGAVVQSFEHRRFGNERFASACWSQCDQGFSMQ